LQWSYQQAYAYVDFFSLQKVHTWTSLQLPGDREYPATAAAAAAIVAGPSSEFGRQRGVILDRRRVVHRSQQRRTARNLERQERRCGTRCVEQSVDGATVDGQPLDLQLNLAAVRVFAARRAEGPRDAMSS